MNTQKKVTSEETVKISPKQVIKNLKIDVQLVDEQKIVSKSCYNNDYTYIIGDMGSGKTFVAVHNALTQLQKGLVERIWITRPILPNNLGILPGDIKEKLDPYVYPIKHNIEICVGSDSCKKLFESGLVQIMPIDVAKGVTFVNSFVILDEFQDTNFEDLRTILSRLGKKSKMALCGSEQQISRKIGKYSSIHVVSNAFKNNGTIKGADYIYLKSNHRNETLSHMLPLLDNEHDTICREITDSKRERDANSEAKIKDKLFD